MRGLPPGGIQHGGWDETGLLQNDFALWINKKRVRQGQGSVAERTHQVDAAFAAEEQWVGGAVVDRGFL